MTTNSQSIPSLVQAYDFTEVKQYIKRYPHLFWNEDKVVKVDKLKDEFILQIDCERVPDKIIYNGVEVVIQELKK